MGNVFFTGLNTGPAGSNLLEADTGFDNVSNKTGAVVYGNTTTDPKYEGTRAAHISLVADNAVFRKDVTLGSHYIAGAWFEFVSLPSVTTTIINFQSAGANRAHVRLLNDGTVQVRQGTTAVWDSVSDLMIDVRLTTGVGYWFEFEVNDSANTMQLRVYNADTGSLIFNTSNIAYTLTTFDQITFGSNSNSNFEFWMDRVNIDDAVFLGPIAVGNNWTRDLNEQIDVTGQATPSILGLIFQYGFEGLADGSVIGVGNTPFQNVTGTFTVSTVPLTVYEGTKAAHGAFVGTNGIMRWDFGALRDTVYIGAAFDFEQLSDAPTGIIGADSSVNGLQASIRLTAAGKIAIRDHSTNTTPWTSTVTLLTNTRYWIELLADSITDTAVARIYDAAGTLLEESPAQGFPIAQMDQSQFGIINNATVTVDIDRVSVNLQTWTGPLSVASQFTRVMTETEGLSDDVGLSIVKNITDLQNVIPDQSVSSSLTWTQAPQETIGVSDSVAVGRSFSLIINDSVDTSEPNTTHTDMTDTQTQNEGISDSLSNPFNFAQSKIDSEGLTDSITVGWVFGRTIDDSVSVVESVTKLQTFGILITINDGVGGTDIVSQGQQFGRLQSASDNVIIEDLWTTQTYSLVPSATDAEKITEAIMIRLNGVLVISSGTRHDIAYFWLYSLGYRGTLQDMQLDYLRDQYTLLVGPLPTGYKYTSADLQKGLGKRVKFILDPDPIAVINPGLDQQPLDLVSVTDTGVTFAWGRSNTYSDTEGLSDTVSTVFGRFQTATDSENVTESLSIDQTEGLSDSEGLTDSVGVGQTEGLADSIGITDTDFTATKSGGNAVVNADDLEGITDDTVVSIGHNFSVDDPENLTDAITFAGTDRAPQQLLASGSSVAGTSKTTASWTPRTTPEPERVYLVVASLLNAAAIAPTSVTGNGITWTKILDASTLNVNVNISVWTAVTTGGTAGTILIDFGATSMTAVEWILFNSNAKVSGSTVSGGLKQNVATAQNSTTTPGVSLGSAPSSGNIRIGVCGYNAASTNTLVAESGWVLLNRQTLGVALQLAVEFDQGSPTDQSAGWTAGNASNKIVGVMELEAA